VWDPTTATITATRFFYDGDGLVYETSETGSPRHFYVHGNGADQPLVWWDFTGNNVRRFLHADQQGSIVAVSRGDTGAAVAINSYDAWGVPGANNAALRFGYTGQAWIPELGLWYYKARFYSSALGRFLQVDPVGYKDQVNLYAYVGNDPLDRTDPSGELDATSAAAQALIEAAKIDAEGGGPENPGADVLAVVVGVGVFIYEVASGDGDRERAARTDAADGRDRSVGPGPHAREFIRAGPGSRPNNTQQAQINRMGQIHGCHTCGTRNPGTKSGNFIGNHQPPTKLNSPRGQQHYLPHCKRCSAVQGGRVSQMPPPPPPPLPPTSLWKPWNDN
jgi:RHS repeat-associated protein